jgi:hypothetical protein
LPTSSSHDASAFRVATAPPGPPDIVEHYRFAEENPAVSKVFFRKKVNFHVLAKLAGRMVRQ